MKRIVLFASIIAFSAIIGFAAPAHSQQPDYDASIKKYQQSTAAQASRNEQARYCTAPRSMDSKTCNSDYDQLVAAVEKERATSIKYLESARDTGLWSPSTHDLRADVVKLQNQVDQLLKLTRERYWNPSDAVATKQ